MEWLWQEEKEKQADTITILLALDVRLEDAGQYIFVILPGGVAESLTWQAAYKVDFPTAG